MSDKEIKHLISSLLNILNDEQLLYASRYINELFKYKYTDNSDIYFRKIQEDIKLHQSNGKED